MTFLNFYFCDSHFNAIFVIHVRILILVVQWFSFCSLWSSIAVHLDWRHCCAWLSITWLHMTRISTHKFFWQLVSLATKGIYRTLFQTLISTLSCSMDLKTKVDLIRCYYANGNSPTIRQLKREKNLIRDPCTCSVVSRRMFTGNRGRIKERHIASFPRRVDLMLQSGRRHFEDVL